MSDELVIVPSDGDGYVELARTKTGRLFKKHLLNMGNLRHPSTGETIKIDDKFVKALKQNFDKGVCDIVQVPLANAKNEHSEDPERNIGEVVDIQVQDKKVYAVIDVRDSKHADKLGKTYLGASAMMHLDYTDTATGKKVGPTLLHSCVTNRPYVTGLEPYEEIVAATSDSSDGAVLLLTEDVIEIPASATEETEMPDAPKNTETPKPSLEDILTSLKTDHGIDVQALQAQAGEGAKAAELSSALVEALGKSGLVNLSNGDDAKETVSTQEVVGAVAELAEKNVALTNRINNLEHRDAEHAVDALIQTGFVMPAQKKAYVELKLSNPAMFDQLIPAQPIVKLNNESGTNGPDDSQHKTDVNSEVARLAKLSAQLRGVALVESK